MFMYCIKTSKHSQTSGRPTIPVFYVLNVIVPGSIPMGTPLTGLLNGDRE